MTDETPTADIAQPELPLPFPKLARDMPLLPACMVNEYQYCLRRGLIEARRAAESR